MSYTQSLVNEYDRLLLVVRQLNAEFAKVSAELAGLNNAATSAAITIDSSGNVGIGTTTPTNYLNIGNSSNFNPSSNHTSAIQVTGSYGGGIILNDNNNGQYALWLQSAGSDLHIGSSTGSPLAFTTRMMITNAGNIGIGVTPSTWASSYKAIDIDNGASSTASLATYNGSIHFPNNTYYDTTASNWVYKSSTYATRYHQSSIGDHVWNVAPSGTAGNTVSWTEAMRITNSGNVVINNAAIATTATDGFLYIPTCAGTPTGTPTTYTGRAPIVADSSGTKLWVYIGGAWKSTALA